MRVSVRHILTSVTLVVALTPGVAAAAPITLQFDVTVNEAYSYATAQTTAIDPITFLLSMTFDDEGVAGSSSQHATLFDEPAFAGVPGDLVLPGDALAAPLRETDLIAGRSADTGRGAGVQWWHNFQFAWATQVWGSDDGAAARGIKLSSPFTRVPDFTEPDVDLFLALMASDLDFTYYGYAGAGSGYSVDSVAYRGTATQVVATPEPGTLALVGTGVAFAATRWRRRVKPGRLA